MTREEEQELRVEVTDDRLVISIGIETLAIAMKAGPVGEALTETEEGWDEDKLQITDSRAFALGVRDALSREEEDGTTPVHVLLDSAFERAIEDGCEGVEIRDEP